MEGPAKLFADVATHMHAISVNKDYLHNLAAAVDLLETAMRADGKLLVFGNGGSAADAEHVAAEFVCRFAFDRPALPAVALVASGPLLTAASNDLTFEEVFARQVEALGQPGDVAWGISTSGKSMNVVRALKRARERGLKTIGLCGAVSTLMADFCDVVLAVPLGVTARIQEVHQVTYHAICGELEARLFGRRRD